MQLCREVLLASGMHCRTQGGDKGSAYALMLKACWKGSTLQRRQPVSEQKNTIWRMQGR